MCEIESKFKIYEKQKIITPYCIRSAGLEAKRERIQERVCVWVPERAGGQCATA